MKVLVTGGFGYLGGRIAQFLSANGHNVILGTRSEFQSPDWLPESQVEKIDWNDNELLDSICKNVDVVIHAAGMNADDSFSYPVQALAFNGVATARLVESAIKNNVKKFIYISTAHVYVSPLVGDIDEANCTLNIHPYATSHRAGEDAVIYANKIKDIEATVIRLSNAFGSPSTKEVDCWSLVVNDLCKQATVNKSIHLNSPGNQYRNFISITNVSEAINHILLLPSHCNDSVYNLGGKSSIRIIDLANIVAKSCEELFGYKPDITYPSDSENSNVDELNYSISKFENTGFTIETGIVSEIEKLLIYCKEEFVS